MAGVRNLLFAAALCGAASPAAAQSPHIVSLDDARSIGEVTAAVSIQGPSHVNLAPACVELALPCLTPPTFPDFGLLLSGTIYPADAVGLVAELSVSDSPWFSYGTVCPGSSVPGCARPMSNHPRAALGGIRLRSRLLEGGSSRFRFFGEALAGPEWSELGPRAEVVQAGVGADDYLRSGLIVHVEYGYRIAPGARRDLSTARYAVGIGVPLGSRERHR